MANLYTPSIGALLIAVVLSIDVEGEEEETVGRSRSKRSLWNFCKMIECASDKRCVAYLEYGCWCGLGGTATPVDSIDACCEQHDLCYKHVRTTYDCNPKTDIYRWKCMEDDGGVRTPQCTINHKTHFCELQICHCDQTAVDCFTRFVYPSVKPTCAQASKTKRVLQSVWNRLLG